MMDEISSMVFGALSVVIALVGVVMLANALDDGIRIFGSALILFGIGFAGLLIKRHYDEKYGVH
jgi:hypothetical protein